MIERKARIELHHPPLRIKLHGLPPLVVEAEMLPVVFKGRKVGVGNMGRTGFEGIGREYGSHGLAVVRLTAAGSKTAEAVRSSVRNLRFDIVL